MIPLLAKVFLLSCPISHTSDVAAAQYFWLSRSAIDRFAVTGTIASFNTNEELIIPLDFPTEAGDGVSQVMEHVREYEDEILPKLMRFCKTQEAEPSIYVKVLQPSPMYAHERFSLKFIFGTHGEKTSFLSPESLNIRLMELQVRLSKLERICKIKTILDIAYPPKRFLLNELNASNCYEKLEYFQPSFYIHFRAGDREDVAKALTAITKTPSASLLMRVSSISDAESLVKDGTDWLANAGIRVRLVCDDPSATIPFRQIEAPGLTISHLIDP